MKHFILVALALLWGSQISANDSYPDLWWEPFPRDQASSWEILPQDADRSKREVILSKRNELGVFSNFGHTPFIFDGEVYQSVEAFWQMLKYPDLDDRDDPRHAIEGYPYTREEVKKLWGRTAKKAGDKAADLNKENGIDFVSYKGFRFRYKDHGHGSHFHYQLIGRCIRAKVEQNIEVKELLMKTGNLKLRADHKIKSSSPPAYFYFDILMKLRDKWRIQEN